MKCEEAREHLSAYLDDMLEQDIRVQLEDHLKKCEGCNTELSDLKSLIDSVSSLDQVTAPWDFLDNVKRRLEPRFNLPKFIKAIFLPLQIKIPIQAATVAVSVLLVLVMVQQLKRSTDEFPRPMVSKPINRAEDSKKETLPENTKAARDRSRVQELPKLKETSHKKELVAKTANDGKMTEPQGSIIGSDKVKKEERQTATPIELVLFIAQPKPALTQAKAMESIKRNEKTSASGISEKGGASADRQSAVIKTESQAKKSEDKERVQESSSTQEISRLTPQGFMEELQQIVFEYNGKVITSIQSYQITTPSLLKTEIPVESYHDFCNKLKSLSPQTNCPSSINESDQDMIPVNIKIVQK